MSKELSEIMYDLRAYGVEHVYISTIETKVELNPYSFVENFKDKTYLWKFEKDEKFKTVTVSYVDEFITFKTCFGSEKDWELIVKTLGVKNGDENK